MQKPLQERFDEMQTALYCFILNAAVQRLADETEGDEKIDIEHVKAFDIDPEKDRSWAISIKWYHRPDEARMVVGIERGEVWAELHRWL